MAINQVLSQDDHLVESVERNPGLRVAGGWDEFELAVRAIVGQQISLKGAVTILKNLTANFGTLVHNPDSPTLNNLFPNPMEILDADLRNLGLTKSRINAIQSIARDLIQKGSGPAGLDVYKRF